ncbi:hypothetical protein [Parathalassolituus penaei]|uniref:Uncharacterized protein n=1 Tax=Parathalassolituus penaei TaxID=2997323 RepID=A0A9X3ECH5_9GAMM|nr:hypothetical protein [Parathalassolituus penaei]MCY0965088.1 hypothetical protein [Parathalassolituus penaei]
MTAIRSDRAAEIHFMALALSFEIETGERFRWKNNPDVMALMLVQALKLEHHELRWRAERYLQILKDESRADMLAMMDKIRDRQHRGYSASGLHRTEAPISRKVRTIYRGASSFRPAVPDPVSSRPVREAATQPMAVSGEKTDSSITQPSRGPVLLEPLEDDWLNGKSA